MQTAMEHTPQLLWNVKEKKNLKLSHVQWCCYFMPCIVGRQNPACPRAWSRRNPRKTCKAVRVHPHVRCWRLWLVACEIYMRSSRSCICKTSLMRCGIISPLVVGFSLILWPGGRIWCGSDRVSQRLCPEFLAGMSRQGWWRTAWPGLGFGFDCPTVRD